MICTSQVRALPRFRPYAGACAYYRADNQPQITVSSAALTIMGKNAVDEVVGLPSDYAAALSRPSLFQLLPEELLLRILYYLDIPELLITSRVGCYQTCKREVSTSLLIDNRRPAN